MKLGVSDIASREGAITRGTEPEPRGPSWGCHENLVVSIRQASARVSTEKLVARLVPVHDVHDLTGVFDRTTSLIYLDWHHTTPEANALIAEAMARVIQR